ncbi:uncharacterized protein [Triticum aestivum]|uniref:uncharacterized protein n=1 Tax=Triticum aestivum TaxID=4565 RepID=UPI001D0085EF|nr:uncharacterized protein LOC123041224 [Triticum aestivum]
MGALHNLTLQNSTNGWIADSRLLLTLPQTQDSITKVALHRCNSSSELYPIFANNASSDAVVSFTATVSWLMDLWHRRLGHPGAHTFSNKGFSSCNKTLLVDHFVMPASWASMFVCLFIHHVALLVLLSK